MLTAVCVYRAQQLKQPLARTVSSVTVTPRSTHPAAAERVCGCAGLWPVGDAALRPRPSRCTPHTLHIASSPRPCPVCPPPTLPTALPGPGTVPAVRCPLPAQSKPVLDLMFLAFSRVSIVLAPTRCCKQCSLVLFELDRAGPCSASSRGRGRGSEMHPCGRCGRCRATVPAQGAPRVDAAPSRVVLAGRAVCCARLPRP